MSIQDTYNLVAAAIAQELFNVATSVDYQVDQTGTCTKQQLDELVERASAKMSSLVAYFLYSAAKDDCDDLPPDVEREYRRLAREQLDREIDDKLHKTSIREAGPGGLMRGNN